MRIYKIKSLQSMLVLLSSFAAVICSAQGPVEEEPMSPDVAARWAITDGPDDVYIRAAEPLDEWRYYCLDIPGSRDNLVGHLMNVHTCKEGMWHRDTIFSYERTLAGDLYMPEYDLCIETDSEEVGSTLHLANCSDHSSQKWSFDNNAIRLRANSSLCITFSPVLGQLTTGGLAYPTGYKSREISLQNCSADIADRQGWTRAKPMLDLEAPILPDGSPADWRDWVNPN